ncbi:MAG: NdvB, partial [Bacillota bacterium]|nr:NdvB [Bacillota bacterium]
PINHSETPLECERYKVEPYVMTADVYFREPNIGRGGWSWYTGAAGWMYRVGIEAILGLKLNGDKGFTVEPSVPYDWEEYSMEFKYHGCIYNILVKKGTEKAVRMNGEILEDGIIPWRDSGEYNVEVII